MDRREWLTRTTLGTAAALPSLAALGTLGQKLARAEMPVNVAAENANRGTNLKITDVRAILTAPAGIRLVVIKIQTSDPGLYGLGCGTFTQRPRTVETAVNQYLKPFLIGKDPSKIEDLWQSAYVS